jgi:hypothetical protein
MVFKVTFNNISVISWLSVVLVEDITDPPQVTVKLDHIMLYQVHLVGAHNFSYRSNFVTFPNLNFDPSSSNSSHDYASNGRDS